MTQRLTTRTLELRRVVVTGLGTVNAVGNDPDRAWRNLLAGVSGIEPIRGWDASDFEVRFGGEVKDFDPTVALDRKDARRLDPVIHFATVAADQAVTQAKLEVTDETAGRIGVLVGSGIGGIKAIEDNHSILLEKGPRRLSPFFVPNLTANMSAGVISMRTGARGPNLCIATACSSGAHAIGQAYRLIQRGDADVMIAGGTECAVRPLSVAGFACMKALSRRNEDPARASRPFDRGRDGFVVGDGAGIVVLESLERALDRGAAIHAEVVGFGMSGDAHHMTAPPEDGGGAQLCMRAALADAGLTPADIDYINAHGTSTPHNDRIETRAIRAVFGADADRLMVSSTKSMTGHALGAAGGIESVFSILTLREQRVPPTINYDDPDPDCDLDYVPNRSREAPVRVALSNSFGFGGTNASLAFARYLPEGDPR
ncbi:MAG: beta-ketoacyl-ACP synthase II [Myxococcota bacterium]